MSIKELPTAVPFVAATLLASGEGLRGYRDTMMFLPRAWMIVPYVVLQLIIAVLAIKALSLRKLFVLSAVFLLAVNLLQAVPSSPQVVNWIVGMFWGIGYNLFGLLVPVLLLALIQRRRVSGTPVLPSISEAVGVPDAALPQPSVDGQRVMWRWYYWDVGLSAILLWVGAIIDPWGILSYLGGLVNVPFVLMVGLLMWGSGIMGTWGLVVGDKEMETPPSDFSRYGEVRETAAPGAYIWYSLN